MKEGKTFYHAKYLKGNKIYQWLLTNFSKEWHLYMLSDDFLSFLNAAVNKYKLT